MTAVWFRARAEFRQRFRATLALVVVLGLLGGAVLASIAGARRTDSAYDRFLDEHRSFDAFVGDFSVFAPIFWEVDFEALAGLPYVEWSLMTTYFPGDQTDIEGTGSADSRYGTTLIRRKILEGREARAVDEVTIPFAARSLGGIDVGDRVTTRFLRADDPSRSSEFTFRVVGRQAAPGDFPPVDLFGDYLVVTPEFVGQNSGALLTVSGIALRFERGAADLERFDRDIEQMAAGRAVSPFRMTNHAQTVRRSFRLQATALWMLGGLLGIAALLIVGQTIARQIVIETDEHRTLRALAMTRGQLIAVPLLRVAITAAVGAMIAVLVAFAASPLFPFGSARIAEPHPGLWFDATVLGLGAVALTMLVIVVSLPAAAKAARRARLADTGAADQPSAAASIAARTGLGASAVVGIRHALEQGRGRAAVPVRSTVLAIAIGIAALAAAFTFGSSLDHLLATPRLYGVAIDHVYGFNEAADAEASARTLADDPDVAAVAIGSSGIPALVEEIRIEGIEFKAVKGSVFVPLIVGRMPGRGEVVVGPRTLREAGKKIGDEVRFGIEGFGSTTARISGVGVLPPVSEQPGTSAQFGEGVIFESDGMVCPPGAPRGTNGCLTLEGETPPPVDVLVRFRDGVDVAEAIELKRSKLTNPDRDVSLFLQQPADLVNFGRVDNMPTVLGSLLALLSAAALAHVLVTSVARRRRDHAVLKTLGFTRSQVRRAYAWQATTTVLLALAVALPSGAAAGRWLWVFLARRLGVVPEPRLAWLAIAITPVAAFVLANLIAAFPARAAARTPPAEVLRAE